MPDPLANFAGGTLASVGVEANVTTITLASGQGSRVPDPATLGQYDLTLYDSTVPGGSLAAYWAGKAKMVRVTAKAGDVLTVVDGAQGTPTAAIATADAWDLPFSEGVYEQLAAKEVRSTASGTTPTLTFTDTPQVITMTTSGNTTFTLAGMAVGRKITLVLTADATRTLAFAGTHTWLEAPSTGPTTIASGKVMELSFECDGTTAGSVRAAYAVSQ